MGLIETLRSVVIVFPAADAGLVVITAGLFAQFVGALADAGVSLGSLFAQAGFGFRRLGLQLGGFL